ncbi:hypothetical protein [Pseudanabaena sp. 'Roaring Creek']|uniref:hypothetical protein n=1 Tax=Pseudanabaena sp. 'Roaring Creek' TaxID=1681830 RepID=UPI0006D783F9|nr:hypothetical protein [Pseudanabaena sp. 'Roaring Creek']
MFKIPGYYLISPNDHLRTKLLQIEIDNDILDLLSTNQFWEYYVGVGNSFGDNCEDILEVKLLFLASLMSTYLTENNLYKTIFETDDISLETFDNWWNIQRYLIDETFEGIKSTIPPSVRKHFVKTGIFRIDRWIEEMQEGL